MTATYNTIIIGSNGYDVYADLATANEYLEAESWATDWRDEADDDVKGRALVTATRTLDKLQWPGTKTDDDQILQWPRTGTGASTDLVPDEYTIPQRIIDAACVLAALILSGVDITGKPSTQSGAVKSQSAGSVSITYFRDVDDSGTRLPLAAWELVSPILAGASGSAVGGARSFGTSECSDFATDYTPSHGL